MGIINSQMKAPDQAQAKPAATTAPAINANYAKVIIAATKMIYNSKAMKGIISMIANARPVEAGLAKATVMVMMELVKQSKGRMPMEVRTPAAKEIMALIAELAEKAGAIKSAPAAVRAASVLVAKKIMKQAKLKPEQVMQAKPRNQFQPFVSRP